MAYVDICVRDRETCPAERPVLQAGQRTGVSFQQVLRRETGVPVDLTGKIVKVYAREAAFSNTLYLDKFAEVPEATASEGVFQFALQPRDLPQPGMFLLEFAAYSDPEGFSSGGSEDADPVAELRVSGYLEVSPSLTDYSRTNSPLTIAEVRLSIRDSCAQDNFLLDTQEYKPEEIAWAIRRPVDYWNSALPPLRQWYTPVNFPYRYQWLNATVGELMVLAGTNRIRNNLEYSAGGVSVNDSGKGPDYINLGKSKIAEYQEWVRKEKQAINIRGFMGSTRLRSFD